MTDSSIPNLHDCALYHRGHTVHFVQGLRSGNAKRVEKLPHGQITALEGELIMIETDDGLVRYRNHDLDRLRLIIEAHGANVLIDDRWELLKIPHGDGVSSCISIEKDRGNPLESCVERHTVTRPESVEAFVDTTMTLGGATLNPNHLRRDQNRRET